MRQTARLFRRSREQGHGGASAALVRVERAKVATRRVHDEGRPRRGLAGHRRTREGLPPESEASQCQASTAGRSREQGRAARKPI